MEAVAIVFGVGLMFAAYIGLIYYVAKVLPDKRKNKALKNQRKLSDHDLLRLISQQPDGLISAEILAEQSSLSVKESKTNLRLLARHKILKGRNAKFNKFYYELQEELSVAPYPKLSDDPFPTLEDLLILFKHFDYRLNLQDLCLATKLPVGLLIDELKYFLEEGVIERLRTLTDTIYVLKEPYRSSTDGFIKSAHKINLDLGKLYEKVGLKRR